MSAGITSSLGYYSDDTHSDTVAYWYLNTNAATSADVDGSTTMNALNFLGYIPVVGAGVAIARAYVMSHGNSQSPSDKDEIPQGKREFTAFVISQIVRAFFEFVGAGFLFIIPDLIVTHMRDSQQEDGNQTTSISAYA